MSTFLAMVGAGAAKAKSSDDKAPVIVDHLESQVVKDGDQVLLSCRVTGKHITCSAVSVPFSCLIWRC